MRFLPALGLVLVALLVVMVRHATRNGPAVQAATPQSDGATPARTAPRAPAFTGSVIATGGGEAADGGIAHLHGRVLLPPGIDAAKFDEHIVIIADDGTRSFTVRASDDRRFALHLPPGRYELTASTLRNWAGTVTDLVARAGAERRLDIQLAAGAAIRGRLAVRKPDGIDVRARLSGGSAWISTVDAMSDSSFEIPGLIAGRRYDIEVSGLVKTTTVRDVPAPATGVEIAAEPLAVLRGAFGFPRGGQCPITEVELTAGDDSASDDNIGHDCRFEILVPETGATAGTVTATGDGWHVEQAIVLPAHGDPEAVCLNPPCRADPLDGLASLEVRVDGIDTRSLALTSIQVTANGDSFVPSVGCMDATCRIEALSPGQSYEVTLSAIGCQTVHQRMMLAPGINTARITCRRERTIQGVVRVAGEAPEITVRCEGGRTETDGRLFQITCAADDKTLEYSVGPDGPWRRATIPDGDAPFVEIAL